MHCQMGVMLRIKPMLERHSIQMRYAPCLNKIKFLFLISASPYEKVTGGFVGSTLKLKQVEQADSSGRSGGAVKTE